MQRRKKQWKKNHRRQSGPRPGQAAQLRTMGFEELFAHFFEKMHGRTLTPEETAALAQLRQEAGL